MEHHGQPSCFANWEKLVTLWANKFLAFFFQLVHICFSFPLENMDDVLLVCRYMYTIVHVCLMKKTQCAIGFSFFQVMRMEASAPKSVRKFLRTISMDESQWKAFASKIMLTLDDWKTTTMEDQAAYLQAIVKDYNPETARCMALAINELLSLGTWKCFGYVAVKKNHHVFFFVFLIRPQARTRGTRRCWFAAQGVV